MSIQPSTPPADPPIQQLITFFKLRFDEFTRSYLRPEIKYISYSFHTVTDSSYMHDDIKRYINSTKLKCAKSEDIEIYYNKKPKYYIEFILFYIKFIQYLLLSIKPSDISVSVKVYLTPFKKKFPEDDGDLTALNINSGVTISQSYSTNKRVIVYREEEVFKVLMHELIHAFECDATYMSDHYDVPFADYFGRNTSLRVNESYTDTLACIYNSVIFAIIFAKLMKKDSNYLIVFVIALLTREREYILLKCKSILEYEKCGVTPSGLNKTCKEYEKTHIISYYVLKAMNFFYLNKFITSLVQDGYYMKDPDIYVNRLKTVMTDENFWSVLSCLNNKTLPRDILNTLRMHDIEINILILNAKDKLLKSMLS